MYALEGVRSMESFLLLQKKVRGICSGDGDEDEGNLKLLCCYSKRNNNNNCRSLSVIFNFNSTFSTDVFFLFWNMSKCEEKIE